MKKILSVVMMFVFSVAMYAQKDVTKFLGIPVDGFKSAMIQKLKDKGFVSSMYNKDVLEGEFNGTQVRVSIGTNNNKVYRIFLYDVNPRNETDIKIRFNRLCQQFENNSKYISFDDYEIPDDEDISYEIMVNKKRYEALFYQLAEDFDATTIKNGTDAIIKEKYSQEELNNPTEEIRNDISQIIESHLTKLENLQKRMVWFMINEHNGEYVILMYYDNEYNIANGEDL